MPEQSSRHSSTKGIALSLLPKSQGDYHLNPEEKTTINFITEQHSESKQRTKRIFLFPQKNLLIYLFVIFISSWDWSQPSCSLSVFNHQNLYRSNFITIPKGRGKISVNLSSLLSCIDKYNKYKERILKFQGLTIFGKEFKHPFKTHYTGICTVMFTSCDM